MVAFIDAHREAHGVVPICEELQIAPSTYYEHRARAKDPDKRPAREKRDEQFSEKGVAEPIAPAQDVQRLQNDRRLVVVAAGQAQQAVDHILGRKFIAEEPVQALKS